MKALNIFWVSAILLFLSNSLQAQTAMFGTNPQHTGVYNSSFSSDIKLIKKWKFKTDGMIFSSAIVVDNIIYFGSDDSCMYAIDTLGVQKWKFKSNGKIRSTPIMKDTIIYFNNYGGRFYALNIRNGEEIWKYETEGESAFDEWDFYQSSPVYLDTIAYFGSGKSMYAVNLIDGEKLWKYSASNIIHSSPALYNGKLYFGCWNKNLFALDAFTGVKLWEFPTGDGIPSSPSVIDSFVFIGSRDAKVYAIHANTGKKLWSKDFSGSWMPSSFAVFNDTVYTGSSDAQKLVALNKKNGQQLYSIYLPCYAFSTPAFSNGTIFMGSMNGSMYCFDAKSRKIISRFDTDAHIKDAFNALNEDGTLNRAVVKDPQFCKMMFTSGTVASTPVINNNTIYFGSTDSCFYAITDDADCKIKFQVSNSNIDLGVTHAEQIDTSFQVSNISDCEDSVKVNITGNLATFAQSFDIQPASFIILPGNSVEVHIILNTADLDPDKIYTATIATQSKKNEYNYLNTLFSVKTPALSGVSEIEDKQTDSFYPNPFIENAVLKYTLIENCSVDIRIYNSFGQLVKVLVDQKQTVGEYNVSWDGRNNSGNKLSPGFYFCSIQKGHSLLTKELLLTE